MTSLSRLGSARAAREPLLVTLPPGRAPHGARLIRLRVPDRPGSLAAITRHLAEQLVGSAVQLVFAEAGFVCIREGHGFLRPLASTAAGLPVLDDTATSLLRSAFFSGECLTADGRVPWAPAGLRELLPGGAVAAIPGGVPASMVLALVRADETPFVAAELERLAALVRVASGTLQLHSASRRVGAV
jgi:hypothetical protein